MFKGLQMHPTSRSYAPRVIASAAGSCGSRDRRARRRPHTRPSGVQRAALTGGRDGEAIAGTTSSATIVARRAERARALAANDEVAIARGAGRDALYDASRARQRVQDPMIAICENQKDRFAILDIPQSKDIEWVPPLAAAHDSSYCAYYWPWLDVDAGGACRRRASSPAATRGAISRSACTAPANLEIEGVRDVALRITEDHIGQLNADGVNTFRLQRGVRPWGARTASCEPEWRYSRCGVFSSCYGARSRPASRGSRSSRTTRGRGRARATARRRSSASCTRAARSRRGSSATSRS